MNQFVRERGACLSFGGPITAKAFLGSSESHSSTFSVPMQLTERLFLEGCDRAARVAFDAGEAEGDRHAGLGQPKLRSGHSPDPRRPARRDESALEKSSDRMPRSHAVKPDVPQKLVDLDAARICPPHLLQESRRVLYPHLPSPTRNAPKHVNGLVSLVCFESHRGARRCLSASGRYGQNSLAPRHDSAASGAHNRVVGSSIKLAVEPLASLIAHGRRLDGAHTCPSRQGVQFVELESVHGGVHAEPK